MRWLMIALIVSLVALLLAAAGAARHIWRQRSRLQSNQEAGPSREDAANPAIAQVEDIDHETES
jgi:hypothetical protein